MTEWRVGPYLAQVEAPGEYTFWYKDQPEQRAGAVETIPNYGLAVLPEGEVREETHGVPNLEAAAYYLAGYWNGRAHTAEPEQGETPTVSAEPDPLGAYALGLPTIERAPRDWRLVEVDEWEGTHAAATTAKMPVCGRKGVMSPVGNGEPSCRDCTRILIATERRDGSHDFPK